MTVFHETHTTVHRDDVVSITTRNRLDGPGIESRRGRDFPLPSRRNLGTNRPPTQRVLGLFRGNNAAAV